MTQHRKAWPAVSICHCLLGFPYLAVAANNTSTTENAVTYTCPSEYPAASLRFIDPPAGWTPIVQDKLMLRGAGISEGPMKQRGVLVPVHRSYKNRKEDIYTHLSGKTIKEKYIWCGYGGWNDILLYKLLDEKISQCVVTYVPRTGIDEYRVKDIVCR